MKPNTPINRKIQEEFTKLAAAKAQVKLQNYIQNREVVIKNLAVMGHPFDDFSFFRSWVINQLAEQEAAFEAALATQRGSTHQGPFGNN